MGDKQVKIIQLRERLLALKDIQIWAMEQQVKAQAELKELEV